MANGTHQAEYLIEAATERVALSAGSGEPVDSTDLIMMGFGYVVYEIKKSRSPFQGKKAMAGGVTGGTIGIVAIIEILRTFLM